MVSEMRARSQVTMPKEIVVNMGLKYGDKFEVFEKDGLICFMPVVVYPKSYVEELEAIAAETKAEYERGEIKGFTNMDELIADIKKRGEAPAGRSRASSI
jgi:bifunctional DNA-binding transcriptional regulator/antitoxin component of YhaV-PrlF toxin-antitoxin module